MKTRRRRNCGLFHVLDLFADFFYFVFESKTQTGYFYIVGFGADCVCLSVKFLNEEIELSADKLFFADFSELRNVRVQAGEFFVDIAFIGEEGGFG